MSNMIDVEAIQERLKKYNLREIALEIKVHENTLYRFMNNRDSRYSTVKKINDWLAANEKPKTDPVKVNHEGHLYTFGESTIEVEYIGDPGKPPFDRVNKGDK